MCIIWGNIHTKTYSNEYKLRNLAAMMRLRLSVVNKIQFSLENNTHWNKSVVCH